MRLTEMMSFSYAGWPNDLTV